MKKSFTIWILSVIFFGFIIMTVGCIIDIEYFLTPALPVLKLIDGDK